MTSMTAWQDGWPDLSADAVRALAPQAFASFDAVIRAVGTAADPALLELVRQRVSMLLGARGDELPALATPTEQQRAALPGWPTSDAFSADECCCLGFAEQFVLDVAMTTDDDRTALGEVLGTATFGFVQALYVLDHGLRLAVVLPQLLGANPLSPGAVASGDLWPALEAMMTAIVRLRELDPLTSELIRLRGARAHNCRLCKALRSAAVAAEHGAVLEQVGDVDNAEIDDARRAALRLTDAILWQPAALPLDVVRQVRLSFSPAQALEIALDVVRNASNKIAVALAADQPHVSSGVEYYDVTETGEYRYGLPAPTAH